jgi:hypothetical protein
VASQLRHQAGAPEPLYQPLLRALADDVEAGGPSWGPLAPVAHLPFDDVVPLRLLGAAHRLALAGRAPDYAAHLPTCGGDGDPGAAWLALRDLCASGDLDEGTLQPVQTNEPARAAALLPGFVEVAARTGLPLRLLEVGASAGLLLRFDAYRYEIGPSSWGPPASPVRITAEAGRRSDRSRCVPGGAATCGRSTPPGTPRCSCPSSGRRTSSGSGASRQRCRSLRRSR